MSIEVQRSEHQSEYCQSEFVNNVAGNVSLLSDANGKEEENGEEIKVVVGNRKEEDEEYRKEEQNEKRKSSNKTIKRKVKLAIAYQLPTLLNINPCSVLIRKRS